MEFTLKKKSSGSLLLYLFLVYWLVNQMQTNNFKFNQLWGLELNTRSHFIVISSFVKGLPIELGWPAAPPEHRSYILSALFLICVQISLYKQQFMNFRCTALLST